MSLKDKIKTAFLEEERNVEMLRRVEKIAEEFSISFATWIIRNNYSKLNQGKWSKRFDGGINEKTDAQLLELFKNETNL